MSYPADYSFPRYLAAKKSVDDRALNRQVLGTLAGELSLAGKAPLRWLEIGAGTGTMLERLLEWNLLTRAHYTAIDANQDNLLAARERLPAWAVEHGFQTTPTRSGFIFEKGLSRIDLNLEAVDVFDFIPRQAGRQSWDVVAAHAFLDLVDIPAALPQIFTLLENNGLFYFTINFDGLTLLEPVIDAGFDDLVQALYHRSMDERVTNGLPSGDSRSGRRLFAHLQRLGAEILEAGASDWVVFPRTGRYPADEAYFLHFIIHTIQGALQASPALDHERFRDWIQHRHQQVENGELVFIAHQIDFVGRVPRVG